LPRKTTEVVQIKHFTFFQSDISQIVVPEQFPFVFTNEPHRLCRVAAGELQERISRQAGWNHLFGLEEGSEGAGKMFGVLVVQASDGTMGYLSGFSGAINGCNNYPGFVPPVFDLLNPKGFFKQGENKLNEINEAISALENDTVLQSFKEQVSHCDEQVRAMQATWKARLKTGKKERDRQRLEAEKKLIGPALEERCEELNRISQLEKIAYKKAMAVQMQKLEEAEEQVRKLLEPIETLKQQRKQQSARLQFEIFDRFCLLNNNQEVKTVSDIFREQGEGLPPAGTGDCAAPRLFQFAFQHKLKPVALAEFWWGASPGAEIRRHKQFYPPCRSKCAPLMQHMLQHLAMDPDPLFGKMKSPRELEIIFEDDWVMVVNKPEQFLSVPGKEITDSVLQRVKQVRPEATGPLLVHRLDMATSGLLLVAKDQATHKALQSQFIKRNTRKRYLAILDGLVQKDRGVIDLPIRVDLDNRPRQLVCYEYGKSARTKWEVISRENGKTRIYFYPVTGRTHQLRVHAAHPAGLNIPILGDELYGQAAGRLYLHAEFIEIIHPQSGEKMAFTAPAPF
jgi:tRNA pseudouridine32 synthase/23S rRNA pseudouridine746 synthase